MITYIHNIIRRKCNRINIITNRPVGLLGILLIRYICFLNLSQMNWSQNNLICLARICLLILVVVAFILLLYKEIRITRLKIIRALFIYRDVIINLTSLVLCGIVWIQEVNIFILKILLAAYLILSKLALWIVLILITI